MRLRSFWPQKAKEDNAEHKLRVSRRSLLAAQQIARLGSWEWDAATDALECSPELARIYGFGNEAKRMTLADLRLFIHPDDLQRLLPQMTALREGRTPSITIEHRIVRPDGRIAWTRSFAHSQMDPQGRVAHMDGAVLDITDQKRVEVDMAVKDMAMDTSLMPITISDNEGRYRYVNRAFGELAGVPAETLVGAEAASFLRDPDMAEVINHGLTENGRWSGNIATVTATGEARETHAVANVIPGVEMAELLVVTSYLDITEERRAVAALRAAERTAVAAGEQAERYLDIAGTVMLALDRDGRIEMLNRRGRELLGWDGEDVTGRDWFELAVPADARDHSRRLFRRFMDRGGDDHTKQESETVTRTGERRQIEWVNAVLRGEDGVTAGLLASGWDVTDFRRTEAQLRQAQKLETVGQLTGGIAHDFNNLLTVILGNTEELIDALDGDPWLKKTAGMVRESANRAADLTHRLLAFSRKQTLAPRVVDINQLLSGLESMMSRTLGESIDLEFVRGAALWKAVVDASQVENAILNLAINARDAMRRGGRLTIETSNARLDEDYAGQHADVRAGQYVAIAVSDTGTGMAPDVVEKAFEPFFTTKGVGEGSGLGLSMVYGFVKQSGGHIKIYSELGEGTTVKIYLPRASRDADAATPPQAAETLPGGAEILALVEDDSLVRPYMETVLRSMGYAVHAFEDGPSLLRAMDAGLAFDLLLSDVVLPAGMNGRVLAVEVEARRPGMKVIFLSGYTENAIVHHGRLDEGVHLLHKPFRKADLARKVRTVLDSR